MFGGSVFVDELPKNNENVAIHIFTRPFDLSSVKMRDSLTIYTTPILKNAMHYGECTDIKPNIIAVLDSGITHTIRLPDGEELRLRFFACETFTLQVLAIFEHGGALSLYTGRQLISDELFKIDEIFNLINQEKIHLVYLDTTAMHVHEFNWTFTACDKIEEIFKMFKHFQINLVLDDFGYEDLLAELVERKLKIHLDAKRQRVFDRCTKSIPDFCTNQSEANIVVCEYLPSNDEIKKRYTEDNIATMKFTCPNDNSTKENYKPTAESANNVKGLFIIEFSPYPTFNDIYNVVNIVAPLGVRSIGNHKKIPSEIREHCRSK